MNLSVAVMKQNTLFFTEGNELIFGSQVRAVYLVEMVMHSNQQHFQVASTQYKRKVTYLLSMMTCY